MMHTIHLRLPAVILLVLGLLGLGACTYTTEPTPGTFAPAVGSSFTVQTFNLKAGLVPDTATFDTTAIDIEQETMTYRGLTAFRAVHLNRNGVVVDTSRYVNLADGDLAFYNPSLRIGIGNLRAAAAWLHYPYGTKTVKNYMLLDTTLGLDSIRVTATLHFEGPEVIGGNTRPPAIPLTTLRAHLVLERWVYNKGLQVTVRTLTHVIEWHSPQYDMIVQRYTFSETGGATGVLQFQNGEGYSLITTEPTS